MNVRALFVGHDGRARAPWRLLLFLLLAFVCTFLAIFTLGPALQVLERVIGIQGTSAAYGVFAGVLLAHWIALRTFDPQPWSAVALDRSAAQPRVLSFGFLLGAIPIAVASLALLAAGLLDLVRTQDGAWTMNAAKVGLLLLPAAFYEELLSRGYLFATITGWAGRRAAVFVTSVGFGLLHLGNPGATALSVALVTLAGFYLAAVLIATRSLYAAWMAHWAWNWVMAALLHVPVSGLPLSRPDYEIVDAGPDWLTGGNWGPEGGAAAAAGMLGGLAYLHYRRRPQRRPTGNATGHELEG